MLRLPCFLLASRVWDISSGIELASHWLEDYANFTQHLKKNNQYSANHS
jgi:hypothetical protein